MSFKKLSAVTVLFLVALFLAGRVLAAVVASLTIQDQQVDLSDPKASVNITLSGDAQTSVPIVITYDDGSTRYLAYTFNYVPPSTLAPVTPCSNEDFATACWQGAQCQGENQESADSACSQNHGAGSVCTRSTGQSNAHDDGCTVVTEPAPPPPPPPPSCDENVYYCDNGTTIHKYGGYYDGNTCQYAFDQGDPC